MNKIRGHLEPLEPKGVHPLVEHKKVKMESELKEKMELIKKMLMNWKVVIIENRKGEGECKEVYKRRKDNLKECEDLIQDISEEVQEIEKGKTDEREVEIIIDGLKYQIGLYI